MNTRELRQFIAKNTSLNLTQAKEATDALVAGIQKALVEKEGKCYLDGIGTFEISQREARTGRNPSTGEALQIAAYKKVSFRASRELKAVCNPEKVAE